MVDLAGPVLAGTAIVCPLPKAALEERLLVATSTLPAVAVVMLGALVARQLALPVHRLVGVRTALTAVSALAVRAVLLALRQVEQRQRALTLAVTARAAVALAHVIVLLQTRRGVLAPPA